LFPPTCKEVREAMQVRDRSRMRWCCKP